MVFVQEFEHFIIDDFFGQSSQKRSFFLILGRQECFLDKKKEVLEMSKKLKFSKGVSPRFLSKNRTFYHLCFLGKSTQKKSVFLNSGQKRMLFIPEKENFLKVQALEIFQRG